MTEYAEDWRAEGACRTADPDLFFPVSGGAPSARDEAKALRVCARCTVRRQCLDFALRSGEAYGIWGGTTPGERTRARRRRSQQKRQRAAAGPSCQEPRTRAS
jgi:WhiB family transcriptional regulator, redox-sensing transcriptional regulator